MGKPSQQRKQTAATKFLETSEELPKQEIAQSESEKLEEKLPVNQPASEPAIEPSKPSEVKPMEVEQFGLEPKLESIPRKFHKFL